MFVDCKTGWGGRSLTFNVVTRYNFSSASSIKSKSDMKFFQVSNAHNLFTPAELVHGENPLDVLDFLEAVVCFEVKLSCSHVPVASWLAGWPS